MIFGRSARAEKARPENNRDMKIRFIKTRLCPERNPFKYQKAVYFIFIMICNKTLVFYQPLALMKKTLTHSCPRGLFIRIDFGNRRGSQTQIARNRW